jgi:hypothetical protein
LSVTPVPLTLARAVIDATFVLSTLLTSKLRRS